MTVYAMASSRLTFSKEVQMFPVSWEGDDDGFWDHRGVIFIDFLPKGETVNSHRYCDTLKKLARAIRVKRPSMQKVILHHDNARPHTAHATAAAIAAKGWIVLPLQHIAQIWHHRTFTYLDL